MKRKKHMAPEKGPDTPMPDDNQNQPDPKKNYKVKLFKKNMQFSLRTMLLFAFAFGAIGSYFVYSSFAAGPDDIDTGRTDANAIELPEGWAPADQTVALLDAVNNHGKASLAKKEAAKAQLKALAGARKESYVSAMAKDPDAAYQAAMPQKAYVQLPDDVKPLVEQRKKLRGTFEYIHYDNFDSSTAGYEYYIKDKGTNKRYRVHMAGQPNALTDDTVQVNAAVLGDQAAAAEGSMQVVSEASTTAETSVKMAVIMFNWQNDTRTPFAESAVREAYFTGSSSSNAYFKENSFGKLELIGKTRTDGDVLGWYTIPYDNTNCGSMYNTWGNAAKSRAQAAGVDLSGYNIFSFIFPSVSCGWSGLAYLGGNPTHNWTAGSITSRTRTHEIGHNLRADHASTWSCTENGTRVAVSAVDTNCSLGEYGDPWSIMGASQTNHLNNYMKGAPRYSKEWLVPGNTHTVNRSTAPDNTYTVVPIEQASTGVQSLRIPRRTSSTGTITEYYYVEFRQPFGFDNFTATNPAATGVSIRLAPDYPSVVRSKLIDTTPATGFSDAPLAVGRTFSDTEKSINITTVSVSPSGAQVRVSFGALPCTRSNPTLSLSPASVTLYGGQSTTYSYTIRNNDSEGCSASAFSLNPSMPSGFTQSPSSVTHNLAPNASASGSLIVTAPEGASPGSYTITQTATNTSSAANRATATYTVALKAPDTAPPSVTITSPSNGSTVGSKGQLKVNAAATDADSGVTQIVVRLNGQILKTCYFTPGTDTSTKGKKGGGGTSCGASVSVNSLSAGTHTINASATDAAGNTAITSITVKK